MLHFLHPTLATITGTIASALDRSGRACALTLVVILACQTALPAEAATPAGDGPAEQVASKQVVSKQVASKSVPTVEELKRWVEQLDDDRYSTREAAQRRLENAGQPALPLVARIAQEGDIEASTRAVNILLKWSSEAANSWRLHALEALTQLKNRPAEAALARKVLERVREEVAMLRLLEAGAKIRHDRSVLLVRGTQMPMQVVIGPDWKGSIETLEALADFRSLSTLSFYSAPFDQETLEKKVLPKLKNVKQVRVLQIYGTSLSETALANLKAELPMIDSIDVRSGGARLGVRGSIQAQAQAGRISDVEPDSAAQRAGLKAGDTITHVDGVEVRDFKHLTELIAAHRGGDTAMLTVARAPVAAQPPIEPIVEEVEVKFDRWGEDESADELASELTIEEVRQRTRVGPTSISRRR